MTCILYLDKNVLFITPELSSGDGSDRIKIQLTEEQAAIMKKFEEETYIEDYKEKI